MACDLPGTFYRTCSGEGGRSCSTVVALVSYWSYCTQGPPVYGGGTPTEGSPENMFSEVVGEVNEEAEVYL